MINAIRAMRRARGWTLDDVAKRCDPPTTAQTIGRLETGTRTLSLDWLDRIAAALECEPRDLVQLPEDEALAVTALVGADGAHAPTQVDHLPPVRPEPGMLALRCTSSVGDYRSGDIIWCRRVPREALAGALNRDILVPRPAGRFAFGRLLAIDDDKLQLLAHAEGSRQQVFSQPDWVGVVARLIRNLGH